MDTRVKDNLAPRVGKQQHPENEGRKGSTRGIDPQGAAKTAVPPARRLGQMAEGAAHQHGGEKEDDRRQDQFARIEPKNPPPRPVRTAS